jgi:3-hydroxyisobutyrate dehydrogenase
MRVANLVLEEMTEALNRGWADRDSRSPMLLQEERAGVQVRGEEGAIAKVLEEDPRAS